jgi:REP element-mobilizing transposase RayT
MARRLRLFARGLLYYVIVPGNQRRKTFVDKEDYRAYLDRLGGAGVVTATPFTLIAWCPIMFNVIWMAQRMESDERLSREMERLNEMVLK